MDQMFQFDFQFLRKAMVLLFLTYYLFMLLSKLKIKTNRLKTLDQSVHFHLDEEEEEVALQAKKQLEAYSQQILDDFRQSEIISSRKEFGRGADLRESTLTRETENETKSFYSRPHNRKIQAKSSCKCQSHSKRQINGQKSNSPKKSIYGAMNSVKLEGQFENDKMEKQKSNINRYVNRLQIQTQRKLQRSGLFGVTFRSQSTQLELKESPRRYWLQSSRKNRSSRNFEEAFDCQGNKPYSFNETMNGVNKYKRIQGSNEKQPKFFRQQNTRPTTCRGPGVNLRPQFLRLILRIKEKEEAQCKKNIMAVKGRRNRL